MGVRRVGKDWTLDARQFDLWAQGQVSVFRRKADEAAQGRRSGAGGRCMQSKMNLF